MQKKLTLESIKFKIGFVSILFIALIAFLSTTACTSSNDKGCKVLIVSIEKGSEVSELEIIKKAFNIGGMIALDVATARKIDSSFDEKYIAAGSDGKFLVAPAILNFVGGQGWTLIQVQPSPQYYFVKGR